MKFLPLTASLMALALFSAPAFLRTKCRPRNSHRLQLKRQLRKFLKKCWNC